MFGLSPFGGKRRGKAPEPDPAPVLEQDNLFHPLRPVLAPLRIVLISTSQSPFADLRERAERIRSAALCPVSLRHDGERRLVNFECPYCGWPTHFSQKEWEEDEQHDRCVDAAFAMCCRRATSRVTARARKVDSSDPRSATGHDCARPTRTNTTSGPVDASPSSTCPSRSTKRRRCRSCRGTCSGTHAASRT